MNMAAKHGLILKSQRGIDMGVNLQQQTVEHDEDMGHEAVHWMGDNFGYGSLIILIVVAGLIVFRRKIIKFLGIK